MKLSKSAKETLKIMLRNEWHKLDYYAYDQKDDLISIAQLHEFHDLVEEFQETYSE